MANRYRSSEPSIGLQISKKVIEMLGGAFQLTSNQCPHDHVTFTISTVLQTKMLTEELEEVKEGEHHVEFEEKIEELKDDMVHDVDPEQEPTKDGAAPAISPNFDYMLEL